MHIKSSFLLIVIVTATLLSCAKKNEIIDGIQLNKKSFSINKNTQIIVVTTKGINWWIGSAMKDSSYLNLQPQVSGTSFADCNGMFADSTVEIKRSHCVTLQIKINENKTNASRKFAIQLEDGDYFDQVTIIQNK